MIRTRSDNRHAVNCVRKSNRPAPRFRPFVMLGLLTSMGIARALPVGAATINYIGPTKTNTNWTDTANWDTASLPGAGDTAKMQKEVYLLGYDGQTAGSINNSGKTLSFKDSGTFTFNNNGTQASITSSVLSINSTTTIKYTNDLVMSLGELDLSGKIQGPGELTISIASTKICKAYSGSAISATRVNLSGKFYSYGGGGTNFNGVVVNLGDSTTLYENGGNFTGLNGSSLEMALGYQIFTHGGNDAITLGSWKIGTDYLPLGTYDVNSTYAGIDFATIFAGTTMSFTVTQYPVPEPASLTLLAVGGILALRPRKQHATPQS